MLHEGISTDSNTRTATFESDQVKHTRATATTSPSNSVPATMYELEADEVVVLLVPVREVVVFVLLVPVLESTSPACVPRTAPGSVMPGGEISL